jgi:hypothetical protein
MSQPSIEFMDPANLPECSYSRHPMEDIEPDEDRPGDMRRAAELFHRVLLWMSGGKSLVEAGQRLNVAIYILCPDIIGAQTLEKIGAKSSHTRQNIDKLVMDFRDTFRGQRNHLMKSDKAREAFKQAQLSR